MAAAPTGSGSSAKWDETLSNALQLAPQKGVFAADLDAELALRDAGIEPVAMEGFAVWVAKLKPMIQ